MIAKDRNAFVVNDTQSLLHLKLPNGIFKLVDFQVSRFRWLHAFSQSSCSQISLSHVVEVTSPPHGTTVILARKVERRLKDDFYWHREDVIDDVRRISWSSSKLTLTLRN